MTPMSTQRPTPPSFPLRAVTLVVALGLSALLSGCESEQTGYEVTVPLIGPIDFNETSCEISGDICSTDGDCFDEEGFDVGPCTKTMTPLEPITVAVSLSPSSPSYTLPALETANWISLLAALQRGDHNPITLTTENFSVTGGPITLSVRPFSRNGLYLGRDAGYEPVAPSSGSCTFTLDDSSTGEDYSNGITTCLSDWIKENGTPLQFDIEVTSSAGAADKSGFGLKQEPPNYTLNAGDSWDATDPCEEQTESTEALDAVGEGSDFFDQLACENLSITGNGNTSQPIQIYGVATVYDPCGQTATASLGSSNALIPIPGPADYEVRVVEDAGDIVEVEGDIAIVPLVFGPEPGGAAEFLDLFFAAGAGKCLSGEDPPDVPIVGNEPGKGYALVDWKHCYDGDQDPAPARDGSLTVVAEGFCPVADGSGAGGGSGQ